MYTRNTKQENQFVSFFIKETKIKSSRHLLTLSPQYATL